jgi:putative oligomerization/nucleic acid binding protein
MVEPQQLNQLKEQGILSEEEYEANKQQVLGI